MAPRVKRGAAKLKNKEGAQHCWNVIFDKIVNFPSVQFCDTFLVSWSPLDSLHKKRCLPTFYGRNLSQFLTWSESPKRNHGARAPKPESSFSKDLINRSAATSEPRPKARQFSVDLFPSMIGLVFSPPGAAGGYSISVLTWLAWREFKSKPFCQEDEVEGMMRSCWSLQKLVYF